MTTAILVILALTFTITSHIFKRGFLSFAGAGVWLIAAVHCFSISTVDWDTYFSLAFLFIALTFVCIFSPLAWRETTPAGEEPEEPDVRDMREEMEAWNKERRRYSFLYSRDNNRPRRSGTRFQRTKE